MLSPNIPVYSINDILENTKNYIAENNTEIEDIILYFVSEITGLSVDTILEKMEILWKEQNMFVIHTNLRFNKNKNKNHIFFLDDINDIINILYTTYATENEIENISQWLTKASFHQKYQSDTVNIFCLPEIQTRQLATFYGLKTQFEQEYGPPPAW